MHHLDEAERDAVLRAQFAESLEADDDSTSGAEDLIHVLLGMTSSRQPAVDADVAQRPAVGRAKAQLISPKSCGTVTPKAFGTVTPTAATRRLDLDSPMSSSSPGRDEALEKLTAAVGQLGDARGGGGGKSSLQFRPTMSFPVLEEGDTRVGDFVDDFKDTVGFAND